MEVPAAGNTGVLKTTFEELYIAIRKKECRLYTDGQVMLLPLVDQSDIHHKEWEVRRGSAERLIRHLEKREKPLAILEVGCGNGWLAGRLAEISNCTVTGTDINQHELEQAKRVFGKRTNISFVKGDIENIHFKKKFDAIIFAASIQYFPSINKIIRFALSLLNEGGQIHIIDSFFYQPGEIKNAEQRTQTYYRSLGYPAMAEFYFHHGFDDLSEFNHKLLFDPSALTSRIFRKKDPFPWICIAAK